MPRVTGLIWWKVQLSHFKAIYRRGNTAGYTKDFLQVPAGVGNALRRMFHGAGPPYEPIVYRWPGGSYDFGKIYPTTDRLEVGQWTAAGAPHPWQLGDPEKDPIITFPGNPNADIPTGADAEWQRLQALEPWLMVIQLEGRVDELHLRAFLGNPPPHLQAASLDTVPRNIRSSMTGTGALTYDDLSPLWFDPANLRTPWRFSQLSTHSSAPSPPSSPTAVPIGAPYRKADETTPQAVAAPFEVDPDERDRATQAHARTQNALAAAVQRRGCQPRSPAGGTLFDLAWEEQDGSLVVAEVKSTTPQNEERQLRLGLGQVLRYRQLTTARGAVLATSSPVEDETWHLLCAELGVCLTSQPHMDERLSECLG